MYLKRLTILLLAALAPAATVRGSAQVMNGGFEVYNVGMEPVAWNASGSFSSTQASFELFPQEGLRMGIVDTLFAAPPTDTDAEMALGIPSGTIDAAVGGDAVGVAAGWQQVVVNAGDVLEFKWAYMTINPLTGASDDAGFLLIDDAVIVLAWQSDVTIDVIHSSYSRTDWVTAQRPISTTGLINIGFGVAEGSAAFSGSQLLIDDVRIVPVPEPSTIFLLLAAASTAFGTSLRRRRTA